MDDKPSPPTTDDAPDVQHTARKRKLALKTRERSKKEHQGAWRTTGTTETPAEPPTDDDDNNNTLIREMDAPCDEPAIHLKSHSSSSPTTTDEKSFLYTPKTTSLEPQSSFPPSITRINNNIHNNHHQNRHDKRTPFERALNTGIVLCAISTLLALLLLLDAYEYVVVPGSSKPKSPVLRSDASASVSTMMPEVGTAPAVAAAPTAAAAGVVVEAPAREPLQNTTEHTLKDGMEQAQRTVEQKLHELHTLSTAEIETRAESDGIDDTALLATESSDKSPQEMNVQKAQLVEQIAEKELGIDEFCPECMWKQTSIPCQARFHFIQEVYNNDPDDVVKKALLDQGCRKKSGRTRRRRRQLRG